MNRNKRLQHQRKAIAAYTGIAKGTTEFHCFLLTSKQCKRTVGKQTLGQRTFGKRKFGQRTFGHRTFDKRTFGKRTFGLQKYPQRNICAVEVFRGYA